MIPLERSPSSNLDVVRSLYSAGSLEAIERLVSDDLVVTDWMAPGREYRGLRPFLDDCMIPGAEAFPDSTEEESFAFESGGRAVYCAQFLATFAADYKGIPAHGRQVVWTILDTFELRDGLITRIWFGADTLEAYRQLTGLRHDAPGWE